jgi:hypothetical protein
MVRGQILNSDVSWRLRSDTPGVVIPVTKNRTCTIQQLKLQPAANSEVQSVCFETLLDDDFTAREEGS